MTEQQFIKQLSQNNANYNNPEQAIFRGKYANPN
jgi:hypothetical protein